MTAQHTQNALVWHGILELSRGEILSLRNARGTCLEVTAGYLWITQERDYNDLLVLAGQQVRLEGSGKTVISARKDTRVALSVVSEIKGKLKIEGNAPAPDQRSSFHAVGLSARCGEGEKTWLRALAKCWAALAGSATWVVSR